MTFEEAKAIRARLSAEADRLCAAVRALGAGTGPMGLTPEHIKFSPEFRAAKGAYDAAFKRLREFTGAMHRLYKRELREERKARVR